MLASPEFRRLACCRGGDLERMLVRGETPSIESLTGWEYRGYNYARITSQLGIRTVNKCL
jgi:hypothetical protein